MLGCIFIIQVYEELDMIHMVGYRLAPENLILARFLLWVARHSQNAKIA